ncbi:NAD-dependent epimerase/dehydratase family protein [Geminocystis sp. GBBB08]|uniref:NAD-dependent epimerase/dehydratase family protein n=1 Tax=Geminocystis sp. GBBB08 TaxID=2604140 RepID=UPI0027E29DD4|nr:NAD-dependent epimerase/dehydratase family protein [Geminocystis sp. GBBB08]MBL1211118.1 NAD-dependent epimerase/dehydratase family protein [Geminocystis sp. GBBB08]
MKVLVTGGTGFVGGNLTEQLLKSGYQVKVITQKPELIKNEQIQMIIGDITDRKIIDQAVNDCQQIYHLAAKTGRSQSSPQAFWTTNVEATNYLAQKAIEAKVEKFIYTSSAGVYGINSCNMVNEQSPTDPNTIYRRTKLAGEKVLLSYYQEKGLPVVIARLTSMVGKNGLNWLGLTKAIATQNFQLLGSGNNEFNLIHIKDAVRGLQLCGEVPTSIGNCYLIGSKNPVTLREFVTLIAENLAVKFPQENKFTLPFEILLTISQILHQTFKIEMPLAHRYELFLTSRILDTTKAENELGFVPQFSLEEAVIEMIQSLKNNHYL